MTDLITNLNVIVAAIVSWTTNVAELIVDTPLLMFSLGFFAIGGAIGIVGRLLSRG